MFLFFRLALCSYVGLSNRVSERSSGVRGCRAALSHMVLFVCCLLPCLIVIFLFFLAHPFFLGLLLTLVSLRGVAYLPEVSRLGFVSLPYLLPPLACTLVFGHD